VVLEGEELAVPPSLVQEREAVARLNDEERGQTLGGRLHPDVLIPGNAWHPDLLKWRRSAGGSGGHAPPDRRTPGAPPRCEPEWRTSRARMSISLDMAMRHSNAG